MLKFWPSFPLFGLAFILNEKTLGHFLSASGHIQTLKTRAAVWLIQISLLVMAFMLIRMQQAKARRIVLWCGFYLVVTPFIFEGMVRVLISLGFAPLRQPTLYFPVTYDAYWAQLEKWGMAPEPPTVSENEKSWKKKVPDTLLGWAYASVPENILGARTPSPIDLAAMKDPVLFFGDSFMHGTEDYNRCIPKLSSDLMHRESLNLAMGGYGLDQIYLKIKSVFSKRKSSRVVVGILLDDLDRVVLSYRLRPKPYFKIQEGKLHLHTKHLEATSKYLDQIDTSVTSYGLRLLSQRLPTHPFSLPEREDEIRLVSRGILSEMAKELHQVDKSLIVLFYEKPRLLQTDWRESFLKQALLEDRMTVLDTKPLLLSKASQSHISVDEYYLPQDGHLNLKGSTEVSRAIAQWVRSDSTPGMQ